MKNISHRTIRSANRYSNDRSNWYETDTWDNFANQVSVQISDIIGDKYVKELPLKDDIPKEIKDKVSKMLYLI